MKSNIFKARLHVIKGNCKTREGFSQMYSMYLWRIPHQSISEAAFLVMELSFLSFLPFRTRMGED